MAGQEPPRSIKTRSHRNSNNNTGVILLRGSENDGTRVKKARETAVSNFLATPILGKGSIISRTGF